MSEEEYEQAFSSNYDDAQDDDYDEQEDEEEVEFKKIQFDSEEANIRSTSKKEEKKEPQNQLQHDDHFRNQKKDPNDELQEQPYSIRDFENDEEEEGLEIKRKVEEENIERDQDLTSQESFKNLIVDLSQEMEGIRQCIMQGDFQGGLERAQNYLSSNQQCVEAINLRVHCEKQLKRNHEKCIHDLKQCLLVEEDNILTLLNLASICYEAQYLEEAIQYYEKLAVLQKGDERIFFNLAICYERVGDTFSAQINYDKTLKINYEFGEAVVNYSQLLMKLGEFEQARLLLESHLRNKPNDQKALNNLSVVLAEKWQEKRADQIFRSAIKYNNGEFTPTILYNKGILQFKQNRLMAALESFQKFTQIPEVNERDPLNLLSYVNQGLIFEKLGQYESALTVYETILSSFSDIINSQEFEVKVKDMKNKILKRFQNKNPNGQLTNSQPSTQLNFTYIPPFTSALTARPRNQFFQIINSNQKSSNSLISTSTQLFRTSPEASRKGSRSTFRTLSRNNSNHQNGNHDKNNNNIHGNAHTSNNNEANNNFQNKNDNHNQIIKNDYNENDNDKNNSNNNNKTEGIRKISNSSRKLYQLPTKGETKYDNFFTSSIQQNKTNGQYYAQSNIFEKKSTILQKRSSFQEGKSSTKLNSLINADNKFKQTKEYPKQSLSNSVIQSADPIKTLNLQYHEQLSRIKKLPIEISNNKSPRETTKLFPHRNNGSLHSSPVKVIPSPSLERLTKPKKQLEITSNQNIKMTKYKPLQTNKFGLPKTIPQNREQFSQEPSKGSPILASLNSPKNKNNSNSNHFLEDMAMKNQKKSQQLTSASKKNQNKREIGLLNGNKESHYIAKPKMNNDLVSHEKQTKMLSSSDKREKFTSLINRPYQSVTSSFSTKDHSKVYQKYGQDSRKVSKNNSLTLIAQDKEENINDESNQTLHDVKNLLPNNNFVDLNKQFNNEHKLENYFPNDIKSNQDHNLQIQSANPSTQIQKEMEIQSDLRLEIEQEQKEKQKEEENKKQFLKEEEEKKQKELENLELKRQKQQFQQEEEDKRIRNELEQKQKEIQEQEIKRKEEEFMKKAEEEKKMKEEQEQKIREEEEKRIKEEEERKIREEEERKIREEEKMKREEDERKIREEEERRIEEDLLKKKQQEEEEIIRKKQEKEEEELRIKNQKEQKRIFEEEKKELKKKLELEKKNTDEEEQEKNRKEELKEEKKEIENESEYQKNDKAISDTIDDQSDENEHKELENQDETKIENTSMSFSVYPPIETKPGRQSIFAQMAQQKKESNHNSDDSNHNDVSVSASVASADEDDKQELHDNKVESHKPQLDDNQGSGGKSQRDQDNDFNEKSDDEQIQTNQQNNEEASENNNEGDKQQEEQEEANENKLENISINHNPDFKKLNQPSDPLNENQKISDEKLTLQGKQSINQEDQKVKLDQSNHSEIEDHEKFQKEKDLLIQKEDISLNQNEESGDEQLKQQESQSNENQNHELKLLIQEHSVQINKESTSQVKQDTLHNEEEQANQQVTKKDEGPQVEDLQENGDQNDEEQNSIKSDHKSLNILSDHDLNLSEKKENYSLHSQDQQHNQKEEDNNSQLQNKHSLEERNSQNDSFRIEQLKNQKEDEAEEGQNQENSKKDSEKEHHSQSQLSQEEESSNLFKQTDEDFQNQFLSKYLDETYYDTISLVLQLQHPLNQIQEDDEKEEKEQQSSQQNASFNEPKMKFQKEEGKGADEQEQEFENSREVSEKQLQTQELKNSLKGEDKQSDQKEEEDEQQEEKQTSRYENEEDEDFKQLFLNNFLDKTYYDAISLVLILQQPLNQIEEDEKEVESSQQNSSMTQGQEEEQDEVSKVNILRKDSEKEQQSNCDIQQQELENRYQNKEIVSTEQSQNEENELTENIEKIFLNKYLDEIYYDAISLVLQLHQPLNQIEEHQVEEEDSKSSNKSFKESQQLSEREKTDDQNNLLLLNEKITQQENSHQLLSQNEKKLSEQSEIENEAELREKKQQMITQFLSKIYSDAFIQLLDSQNKNEESIPNQQDDKIEQESQNDEKYPPPEQEELNSQEQKQHNVSEEQVIEDEKHNTEHMDDQKEEVINPQNHEDDGLKELIENRLAQQDTHSNNALDPNEDNDKVNQLDKPSQEKPNLIEGPKKVQGGDVVEDNSDKNIKGQPEALAQTNLLTKIISGGIEEDQSSVRESVASDSRMRTKSQYNKKKKKQDLLPSDFESWDNDKCQLMIDNKEEKAYLAHYKLGVIALGQNEVEKAKEHFLIITENQPDFLPQRIQLVLSEIFIQQENWEKALFHYKVLYKNVTNKYSTLMGIGRCFKKLGKLEDAQKSYENAIFNNTEKDYQCFYKLGSICFQRNKIKIAIDNFLKALSLIQSNSKIFLKLGLSYLQLEQDESDKQHKNHHNKDNHIHNHNNSNYHNIEESLYYLSQAILLDENNYDCIISLAKVHEKKEQLEPAIKFAEIAANHKNHNLNTVFYLGSLYQKVDECAKAQECFKKVLLEDPNHQQGLIELATVLALQGEFLKSKKYYKLALKKDPNNLICNLRLGMIYLTQLHQIDNAIECFKKIVLIQPKYSKAYLQLGVAYLKKKDFKNAVESFQGCLNINSNTVPAWKGLGDTNKEAGNPKNALKYYVKGLSIDPNDMEIQLRIANCLEALGNYFSAAEKYELILKQRQNDDSLYFHLGNCYQMQGKYETAIENYNKAIEIQPNQSDYIYNLGIVWLSQGNNQEAISAFKKASKIDPNKAFFQYSLANVYYQQGDHEIAWEIFEKTLEQEPNNDDWRNHIAQTYLEQGHIEKALDHLLKSFNIHPGNCETCLMLAKLYLTQQKINEASFYAKIAFQLDPENEDIQMLYDEVHFSDVSKFSSIKKDLQSPHFESESLMLKNISPPHQKDIDEFMLSSMNQRNNSSKSLQFTKTEEKSKK